VFLGRSNSSPTSQRAKPVGQPRPAATIVKETFEQWLAKTTALPVEKQQVAVIQMLKERNRQFNGQVKFEVKDDQIVRVVLSAENGQDLRPLRALPHLSILDCQGSRDRTGQLSDLRPLQGLPLTELNCNYTRVSDLRPLQGMKLDRLFCGFTEIRNLDP